MSERTRACEDVQALVEAMADATAAPDPVAEAHLATCTRCQWSLELARRIEGWLAARESVVAPVDFARQTINRLRSERWREEQRFDRLFNALLVAAALLVIALFVAAFNISGLGVLVADSGRLVASSVATLAGRLPVSSNIAMVSVTLMLVSVGAWWWAEDRAHA